ncbi:MAG: tRNA guanosine(15) transglycosylase TgtA [Candidatus Thermoplasmatota archaeon]|jgi:7-cyano-7-deazaguanine tRNA-ribosyltransferase|nr:tRNA guanosine(15) transglycosylase TgtA [Candidatus Thermoplasmatota archaeon]
MLFEIKKRDAAARICKFSTKHGVVTTPNLMPVINPNKMILTPKEMKKFFGVEIVITNSYIINKNEKLKENALKEGVHRLIDFDGPIMTDSGTFQSHVYGEIDIDPIEIVEFQRDIGSDIGTILDIFIEPDENKKKAEKAIKETIQRAKKSIKIKKEMALACTIQGSVYTDLREKCARKLSEINADFFPIGGVVPLMENQRYKELIKCIISSKKGLDPSKPVHLFGAGHPLIFPLAVALGCDFFDSSAYAKYANDDRMIFSWGTEKLEDLIELPCCCPVCSNYDISELKKLDKNERIKEIAKHNLYVSFTEIKRIKNAISQGNLWELVERRAAANPYLFESLKELRIKENKEFLEQFEPISKEKAVFYTGMHTIHRPIFFRCHKRLFERYEKPFKTTIVFPEASKTYYAFYRKEIEKIFKKNNCLNLLVDSNLGPVPIELDEMYPFAQSVFPEEIDSETKEFVKKLFKSFIKNKKIIYWKGDETLDKIKSSKEKNLNFDLRKIHAVLDFQFGKGAAKALLNGRINIVKSEKTGKIRNVYCDNKHILSMRAEDGLFTLKINGARLLHKFFSPPKLRVVVEDDAVSFVKGGKSVFAKFVIDCDAELRPLDECLIVSKKDELIGVGRCLLNRLEMLSFNHGVAVKTREQIV